SNSRIRLKLVGADSGSSAYSLTIDSVHYKESLAEIIASTSGPKYATSTFGSYAAGFALVNEPTVGVWDEYRVPVGKETLLVSYGKFTLPDNLKRIADKMMDTIRISEVSDSVESDSVESCGMVWPSVSSFIGEHY